MSLLKTLVILLVFTVYVYTLDSATFNLWMDKLNRTKPKTLAEFLYFLCDYTKGVLLSLFGINKFSISPSLVFKISQATHSSCI